MKLNLLQTFGEDMMENRILVFLRYTITSYPYDELCKLVTDGFYSSQTDFEYTTAVNNLKANKLIKVEANMVSLDDDAYKLFEVLPDDTWYRKKQIKPYTYHKNMRKTKIAGEYQETVKKKYWLLITLISSLLSLGAGLLSGMYLEKWKRQNPIKSPTTIPQGQVKKVSTQPSPNHK